MIRTRAVVASPGPGPGSAGNNASDLPRRESLLKGIRAAFRRERRQLLLMFRRQGVGADLFGRPDAWPAFRRNSPSKAWRRSVLFLLFKAKRTGPTEKNNYNLPTGEDIKKEVIAAFVEQRKQIREVLKQHGSGTNKPELPDAWPAFELDEQAMAERMSPILANYWEESWIKFRGRNKKFPHKWDDRKEDLSGMIDKAALDFCTNVNQTTKLRLDKALAKAKADLLAKPRTKNKVVKKFTERVEEIFDAAENSRARAIAQSEASRAFHAALEQAAIDSKIVAGFEWLPSDNPCAYCAMIGRNARYVKLEHPFAKFGDHLVYSHIRFPPLHPHCYCTCIEVLKPKGDENNNVEWSAPVNLDEHFWVERHGWMPGLRPGQESHHGVMSAWVKANFHGYNDYQAPAVLMPYDNHRITCDLFEAWKKVKRAEKKMGKDIDWRMISEPEIRELSERMFEGAQVPDKIREEYWEWFERMKTALGPMKTGHKLSSSKNHHPGGIMADSYRIRDENEMRRFYGAFYDESPKVEFDKSRIPEVLHPLVPYAEFWGFLDDWTRERLVTKASPKIQQDLVEVTSSFVDELDAWRESIRGSKQTVSDEYVALSAMGMAADYCSSIIEQREEKKQAENDRRD